MAKSQDLKNSAPVLQRKVATQADPGDSGKTVLDFLCHRFDYLDRKAWAHHVAENRIWVGQTPATPERRLSPGELIEFRIPHMAEPPVNRSISIIYDDRNLVAVDKPPNLPCHPAGRYFRHTLWALLKEQGLDRPIFVHRIDRETSGIVLVAKSRQAARHLRHEFEAARVYKRYLAVVEGRFPEETVAANGILYLDPESRVRKKRRFSFCHAPGVPAPGVRRCRTDFKRSSVHADLSLVDALPHTGRSHQIRASLCSLGFPVVGDKLYGVDDAFFLRFIEDRLTSDDRQRLRIERQALHAAEIHIRKAPGGQMLRLSCPLPPDMAGLLVE